jgi:hypothetical protein
MIEKYDRLWKEKDKEDDYLGERGGKDDESVAPFITDSECSERGFIPTPSCLSHGNGFTPNAKETPTQEHERKGFESHAEGKEGLSKANN